nr:facilitated trehalose transporter Tret1-like isoform X1 [Cherax quadricarinatus]
MCKCDEVVQETMTSDDTNTQVERSNNKSRIIPQVLACMAASLGTLCSGAVNGWTAGALTSLDADPHMNMGTLQNAWVVAIIALGAVVGCPLAGYVMDLLGRRKTILVMCPFTFLGWITMALAVNLELVLTGRALCGLTTAFLFSAVPVYCSETPEAKVRGALGTLSSLFLTFGVVLSYVAGACFPWRISCYICGAPCLLTFAAIMLVPESPYWLLIKGKKADAEASLRWLRGPNYDFSKEIAEMEAKMLLVGKKLEFRELWRPRTRRPFLIALFMMTLQQASGGNILIMYTGTIFISAGVADHNMATVYAGLVQIVGTLLSVIMMDRAGRRPMIIISTAVMGTATLMLGVYYYVHNVMGNFWPRWVPLITVLVAVFGYCLGCRTIPWLLSAELFNTTIRSTANAVTLFYNRFLNFTVIQVYPFFEEAAGAHTVFAVFGALCLTCCIISFICVPETKGKTLEQIQEYFEKEALSSIYEVNDMNNQQSTCSDVIQGEANKSLPTTSTLATEKDYDISVGSFIDKPALSSKGQTQNSSSVENTAL